MQTSCHDLGVPALLLPVSILDVFILLAKFGIFLVQQRQKQWLQLIHTICTSVIAHWQVHNYSNMHACWSDLCNN